MRFDSAHPSRMIKSLPYSHLMRVKRIVNIDPELDPALDRMVSRSMPNIPEGLANYDMDK